MSDAMPSGRSAPAITLVTSPACHLCEDAHDALRGLVDQDLIRLTTVRADSPEGLDLVGRHRPMMFPLVLLDGTFFSAGRLPRRKLERYLGRLVAAG